MSHSPQTLAQYWVLFSRFFIGHLIKKRWKRADYWATQTPECRSVEVIPLGNPKLPQLSYMYIQTTLEAILDPYKLNHQILSQTDTSFSLLHPSSSLLYGLHTARSHILKTL